MVKKTRVVICCSSVFWLYVPWQLWVLHTAVEGEGDVPLDGQHMVSGGHVLKYRSKHWNQLAARAAVLVKAVGPQGKLTILTELQCRRKVVCYMGRDPKCLEEADVGVYLAEGKEPVSKIKVRTYFELIGFESD